MDVVEAHTPERRRDRRIPMTARVRIAPRQTGTGLQAELVDVSAGGLRAHCRPPQSLVAGTEVDVEIRVQAAERTKQPPVVNLRGTGVVVRIEADGDKPFDAALRFTGPLELREPFAQLLLF